MVDETDTLARAWKASSLVAFAISQVYAVTLAVAVLWMGYTDDAYSVSVLVALVAAVFAGPGAWMRCMQLPSKWAWRTLQVSLIVVAVLAAAGMHGSPEGGEAAVPFAATVLATVPVVHLLAEAAEKIPFVPAVGWMGFAVAVLASLPIAQL